MTVARTMKILLVEDSRFVRRAAKKNLHELGFQNVIEAVDGNDAIEKLREEKDIQLIISDWVMPDRDGYELLLWVRSDEKHCDVPFIMATARGEKKQVQKAVEAGVTSFITKPFGASELKELIEHTFTVKDESEDLVSPKTMQLRKTAAGKLQLNVAHIQITDHLSLGVLKHLLATEKLSPRYFELETVCMPGWNPVQKALEQGQVDAAFILAPIAMDLFGFGVPIKLVLLAHKNGSIFVRKRDAGRGESLLQSLKDKTFYIPHEMSVHHMLSHMFLRGIGLRPGFQGRGDFDTFFEVLPPIQMPEFLVANPAASGFSVAEPLGTKTIAEGSADLMFLSGELWENHPCCVLAVRDELIEQNADAVQEFVHMLVQAGQLVDQRPETAAAIGVSFLDPNKRLGLKEAILKDVLKEPRGIKTNDLFPAIKDFDRMQRYMVDEMGIGTLIDLEKFIDTRFAEFACKNLVSQKSVIHDVSGIVTEIENQRTRAHIAKAKLNLEGKYLIFTIDNGEYGLNVMGVKEIIETRPVRIVPGSPAFLKGLINFRGEAVPIMDIGLVLGMGTNEYDEHARIVILEIVVEAGALQVGIVTDSVSEVIDVGATDIQDAPSFGISVDTSYILGIAQMNGGMQILLDMKQLLGEPNS